MNNVYKKFKDILASKAIKSEELKAMYCAESDMTFVMKYTTYIDGTFAEEVYGFYYGSPSEYMTNSQDGNILAVFDPAE